jgi:hypothetical protein
MARGHKLARFSVAPNLYRENVCQPGQLRDAHAGGSPVGFIAKHPLGNLRPGVFRLVSSWATILLAPEEPLCTEGPAVTVRGVFGYR